MGGAACWLLFASVRIPRVNNEQRRSIEYSILDSRTLPGVHSSQPTPFSFLLLLLLSLPPLVVARAVLTVLASRLRRSGVVIITPSSASVLGEALSAVQLAVGAARDLRNLWQAPACRVEGN
jgi:hypothetical protein